LSDVLVKRDGAILEITLNRPDDGNAMSDDAAAELTRLLLNTDDGTDAIVLRGAGADFCIGRATMGRPRDGAPPEALARRRSTEVIFDCYGAFRRSAVPIVGVVQGRALGFGCALAALCDVTLASEDATFAIPEMSHNTFPTMVMSALVDRVPLKALTYLVYSTAVISAERALTFGIVSDVVTPSALEGAVATLRGRLAKTPKPALRAVKEYARSAFDMGTAGAVDFARNLHATINSSSEMRRS